MKKRHSLAVVIAFAAHSLLAPAAFSQRAGQGDEGGIAGGTTNGADVIVSTIGGTFSLYGTVGGVAGYAMTTVSCNLGEQDAIWIDAGAQPNRHPVIAQNLYRLKDNRFEQIGMAWLKHGWCAADAPSCGSPYEGASGCDWLGTHATDTYDASLNGTQSDLGPRSEVNPWTGNYPYPYILNWGSSGDAKYKRLQVRTADLDPAQNAGALYYAESQYVCTGWTGQPGDEPPANRYNNVSYRRVLVGSPSGSSWNLSFTGSTTPQLPAIHAWATLSRITFDVPNDGRMILSSRFTDLGGGVWNYEYALYNMNSDRGVQSFQVAVDPCLTLTNVGFHDVDYHSGEPYALTDWPSTYAGGNLSWACDPFTTNANANALRWGTLYNYRFDATGAPRRIRSRVGFFKPGSPPATFVVAWGPSPCPNDMAPNDMGDGQIDARDLLRVITSWGHCESPMECFADIAPPGGDNQVDVEDLIAVINSWGQCPTRTAK